MRVMILPIMKNYPLTYLTGTISQIYKRDYELNKNSVNFNELRIIFFYLGLVVSRQNLSVEGLVTQIMY